MINLRPQKKHLAHLEIEIIDGDMILKVLVHLPHLKIQMISLMMLMEVEVDTGEVMEMIMETIMEIPIGVIAIVMAVIVVDAISAQEEELRIIHSLEITFPFDYMNFDYSIYSFKMRNA